MNNIKLSDNFYLKEFLNSQTATRKGYYEQFNPSDEIIENIKNLVTNILQPLRNYIGEPIIISAGYRCERVNRTIGGAKTSQHVLGQAVDIENFTKGNKFLFDKIIEAKLPFDQLINEFDYDWIHISFSNRNRRQILEAVKLNNKTVYKIVKL
jgi:hypothetical protein